MIKKLNFKLAFCWLILFFISLSTPRILNYYQFIDSDWFSIKHLLKYELINLVVAVLISVPLLLSHRTISIYRMVIGFVIFVYAGLELWHVHLFQGSPNSSTFFSIFTTNLNESWAFVESQFGFWDFLLIVCFWVALIGIHFLIQKFNTNRISKLGFVLLLIGSISSYFYFGSDRISPASISNTSIIAGTSAYLSFLEEQRSFDNLRENIPDFNDFSFDEIKNEVHVIVIGQSTSRHHMGLYNYWRNTNPLLAKNKNLITFSQVSSPHAHTVPSLTKALSFKSGSTPDLGLADGTLIDLLNAAGYETYWLSNQAISGDFETPISIIADHANHKIYTNSSRGSEAYDEVLLSPFQKILNHPQRKVIFVHLMGSHMSYSDRYPKTYQHFSGVKENHFWNQDQISCVNDYDNSVLYNDYIIAQLIQLLEQSNPNTSSSLIYFSDHGDEVYDIRDFHGHSDVNQSKYMTDIPFILWTNDSFNQHHSQVVNFAKTNSNVPYSLENFIHSASDLYGFNLPKIDLQKSLFSQRHHQVAPQQIIPTIQTKNNMAFTTKILCHRVNGIERLQEVKDEFDGFEIDLMYQPSTKSFDVNHPPAKSIGLPLDELIGSLENPDHYYYWLDMKNLDTLSAITAATQLNSIGKEYNITNRIVVESPNLEALRPFSTQGFYTSFYLPFLQDLTDSKLHQTVDSLSMLMQHFQPSCVSQKFGAYPLLSAYFPKCDKLTWDLHYNWKINADRKEIEAIIIRENHLKLFLVRYETNSYR
ncbi:MAG: phosphoethanolamine transferase [Flavobacteriales bacterium]|nr:phosphoethanolamine transferase [Flavobacteriales bacterium]